MEQRRIVTTLAIIAVTGAVSVPNSHAMSWRLDVSNEPVVDRGELVWNPLCNRVADINDPTKESWPQNENYGRYSNQLGGLRVDGTSQRERSGYGMEDRYSSAGEERRLGAHPHGNDFRNEPSPAFPGTPFGEMLYGWPPTTPSADPLVMELSREPVGR